MTPVPITSSGLLVVETALQTQRAGALLFGVGA